MAAGMIRLHAMSKPGGALADGPGPVASGVSDWPSVGLDVPTRDRREALRAAISSVRRQDYPRDIQVVVVHGRIAVDERLADGTPVRVLANARSPGLAG